MGDWPILSQTKWGQDDLTFNPYTVLVTPHASANTKSVYTQIVAAAPFDVAGLLLNTRVVMQTAKLLDIAVGGAGTEQVIVPNFPIFATQGGGFQADMESLAFIPIVIRKGARIAVRFQGNVGAAVLMLKAQLLSMGGFAGFQPSTKYEAWGANLAASHGTTVVSGAGNTKGAYAELIAATGLSSRWVLLSFGLGSVDEMAVDIAIGGVGSEQVVIPNIYTKNQNQQAANVLLPLSVPKGTRISARSAAVLAAQTAYVLLLGGE